MEVIRIVWEFPQTLLGCFLLLLLSVVGKIVKIDGKEGVLLIRTYCKFNISFGLLIFLSNRSTKATEKHELGHSKQSRMLGWLYLPFVGIPSITLNILCRLGAVNSENYYKYYPESWADRLGGVKRYAARSDRTV